METCIEALAEQTQELAIVLEIDAEHLMFQEWECSARRICLCPGDLLAAFSDGITEAARGDDEFGEARLIEILTARSRAPTN